MGGIYWLASYPKSGNTWFRTWLRNLRGEDALPADINAPDAAIASSRAWLDATLGFDSADLDFDEIDRLRPAVYAWRPAPDTIGYHKAHDAYLRLADGTPLLGGGPSLGATAGGGPSLGAAAGGAAAGAILGAVYLIRNPLDIAPSYTAHNGRPLDRTIAYMADPTHGHNLHRDRLGSQLRQVFRDWSSHVTSWVDAAEIAVHIVRYEDMHADPRGSLARAALFLGLCDDPARIDRAVRASSFEALRAQERASGFAERPPRMSAFFREGRTGGWRDRLSAAQVARIIADHGPVMRRFGYLDDNYEPM